MSKEIRELVRVIMGIESEKEMLDFLQGILTPQELMEIPQRLQIVKLLKKGVNQHTIAEELGVGVGTVTRGSKELQKGRFKNV